MMSAPMDEALLPLLRERLTRSIVEDLRDISETAVLERLQHLGCTAIASLYQVFEISLHFEADTVRALDTVLSDTEHHLCDTLHQQHIACMHYCNTRNNVVLVVAGETTTVFAAAREALTQALPQLTATAYMGIGSTVSALSDIKKSADEALICLSYKYTATAGNIIDIRDIQKMLRRPATENTAVFNLVIGCFLDGDVPKLKKRLDELLDNLQAEDTANAFAVRQAFITLTAQVLRYADDTGVADAMNALDDAMRYIMKAEQPALIEVWFINLCIRYMGLMRNKRNENASRLMTIAIAYVENHYSDCKLSQQTVSAHMHLSSAYFGQLFFAQTGKKFVDYLKEYRVEMAKQMLRGSHEKIKVISDAVGFSNVNYFNTVFKKQMGVTPQEYRNV